MIGRLVLWALRRYFGGPAKSWVFTTAVVMVARMVRSVVGRRELVDLSSMKPGQTMIVEHLPISHRRQIKDIKKEKRATKRARKAAAKA